MIDYATFGAGCFWGVEAAFQKVKGVISTAAGYMGGTVKNPTYEQVCANTTGHAEVVQIEYDPAQISYEKLLEIFWNIHNPTTYHRQGPDIGSQYRSAIFYHNEAQHAVALALKEKLEKSGKYKNKIITEITLAGRFYKAEEYHQKYFEKQGINSSCHL